MKGGDAMFRTYDPVAGRRANVARLVVQGPVPSKEKDRRANAGLSRIRHDERLRR
jgi:hypothetical protein